VLIVPLYNHICIYFLPGPGAGDSNLSGPQQQPTSDFEEEWSEHEEAGGHGGRQLLELALTVGGVALAPVRLLVSRQGVLKLPDGVAEIDVEEQYRSLRKTILPIRLKQQEEKEGEAESAAGRRGWEQSHGGDSDTERGRTTKTTSPPLQAAVSVTSDLPASPPASLHSGGPPSSPSSGGPPSPNSSSSGGLHDRDLLRLTQADRQRTLCCLRQRTARGDRLILKEKMRPNFMTIRRVG
jgi:hypothetical protein